jgi:hypothetical protein
MDAKRIAELRRAYCVDRAVLAEVLDALEAAQDRLAAALELLGPMEEAARKATEGPWSKCETSECAPLVFRERPDLPAGTCEVIAEADWGTHEDFIHIAATNQAAVLAVVRALRGGE